MDIAERVVEGVTVLDLMGTLDFGDEGGGQKLRERVDDLLACGQRRIGLNFEKVTSIDAPALGTIVSSYAEVHRRGGQLKIMGVMDREGRSRFETIIVVKLVAVFDELHYKESEMMASFAFSRKAAYA